MKTLTLALAFLLASPALGGTISGFRSPSEVRELTLNAMAEWIADPDDATACGGGDCCPDTRANEGCTGSGTPAACCSGAGAGTCNDQACVEFSLTVQANQTTFAGRVEEQYPLDGDWVCNTWPQDVNSNRKQTACTTVSVTPLVDVSRILSAYAAVHNPQL